MVPRSLKAAALLFGITFVCAPLYHFYSPRILRPFRPSGHSNETWILQAGAEHETQLISVPGMYSPEATPLPDSLDDPPLYPSTPPRLTLIAIWIIKAEDPIYLPNFFASIAANPSIDLLFIKFDKRGVGCQRAFAPHVSNVREVCLSSDEYWSLHMKFLCKSWGGCSEAEEGKVMDTLFERGKLDYVNSYFRPFRSALFDRWINPRTSIWGWCDMDTFMGDFNRNFPWDVARNFDFIFPAPPSYSDNILLYFPGHLAFFKNAPYVINGFLRFPNFRSIDAFMSLPWLTEATEEAEYSHWALTQTNLTFLRFTGMAQSDVHFSSPNGGTFAIEDPVKWRASSKISDPLSKALRALLAVTLQGRHSRPPQSTFTDAGKEYVTELRESRYQGFLWFPRKYAVDVLVNSSRTIARPHKRYLMRRQPNGPVYDRTEPIGEALFAIPKEAYTNSPEISVPSIYAWDMLYTHFQAEKYLNWWRLPGLPPRPISPEEVLFVDKERGALVWNFTGDVTFEAIL